MSILPEEIPTGAGAVPFEGYARDWVRATIEADPVLQSYGAMTVVDDKADPGTPYPFILIGRSADFDASYDGAGYTVQGEGVLIVRAVARTESWDGLEAVQARLMELFERVPTQQLPNGAWMAWCQFTREYPRTRSGDVRSLGALFRIIIQAP